MIINAAWGALFARRLSQRGILVVCLDYRNFPQGTVTDMVEDCNHGISWAMNNCHLYGGDQKAMYLVGQSAGVHLSLLALLAQAKRHIEGGSPMCSIPSWNPSRLLGYIGVSGTYNLVTLTDYLDRRGLYKSMMFAIMSDATGKPMIEQFSPTLQITNLSPEIMNNLPPFTILHGTADMSVPVDNAIEFAKTVNAVGGNCKLHLYRNKTHTQPILEDPMRGGRDILMDDVLSVIRGEACSNHQFPMAPSLMINAATFVCPF
jgi:prenylcysteine alpha-carboxyl methylesterase